jgi:hypothetical protein
MSLLEYAFLPALFIAFGLGFWLGMRTANYEDEQEDRFRETK